MELKKGAVVYSLAGHDKGTFQVVMDFDSKYAMVCDGKYRLLERLKKKNLMHMQIITIQDGYYHIAGLNKKGLGRL